MTSHANKACIVGIGHTKYTKWGGITDKNEFQLACEAIQNAVADAGLDLKKIDGFTSYSEDRNEPILLQCALGLPLLRFSAMVWGGGGGGSCGSVALAAAAVESGQADYVVAFRALAQGQHGRYGQLDPDGESFTQIFGLLSPAQMLALPMRRHMHEYGTKAEHFGEIALTCRENAHRNPNAVMKDRPLDMDTYLQSRMISGPLRLFDCCQENDGAAAVLITTRERAVDLNSQPVFIPAAVHGAGKGYGMSGALGGQNPPLKDYASSGARAVAKDLYNRSGITHEKIDVAQIYENFTGQVLMAIEDYGFCEQGQGGPFVADGNIRWPSGSLPINTHGGHLSEAYVHGMNHVIEGVRQIRGISTSQVTNAKICLVTGGPGIAPTSALILSKEND
jgi:acetyl-CoA acetyltransferase